MISTASAPIDFVRPGYESSSYLGRPLADEARDGTTAAGTAAATRPLFVTPADLGAPLYPTRSRMSAAPRVWHPPAVREACMRMVAAEGGTAFFERSDWRARLDAIVSEGARQSATETEAEQQANIERELDAARSELNDRLATRAVNHVCLPWGISSELTAAALQRLRFATAVANRMPGMFAVRRGDHPFWLKRLPNRYIYRLPGSGRRWWFLSA
jgi:hypothetical protein